MATTIESDDRILVTVQEAARLLSVSTSKVYEFAACGFLEKRYIGSARFRIPMTSLRSFVQEMPGEPRASWS